MESDEVLHRALLRWAPGEAPPPEGAPLNSRQIGTFSLACRNVLVDELRAFSRRRKLAETVARLPGWRVSSTETSVDEQDLVRSVFTQLDPAAGQVLRLRYFEQLSFAEIGARLGFLEATARQIHSRSIRALRDTFKQQGLL